MDRWEHFLTADRRDDLSVIENALAWAAEVYGSGSGPRGALECWEVLVCVRDGIGDSDRDFWRQATHSLRSVARRVKKFRRGRAAEIDPLVADRVAAQCIAGLKPRLKIGPRPVDQLRVRYVPNGPVELRDFATAAADFWAAMFGSLIQPDPVCADCGRDLDDTKKGNKRRATRCGRCAQRHFYWSLTAEERRALNKKKNLQRRHRERVEREQEHHQRKGN